MTNRRPAPVRTAPTTPPPTDEQMLDRMVRALLDQRLAPGTRLREDELGSVFGVSRTRARQLLIRLAGEQLVTLVPHAGARVAEPTPDDAREVFFVRRLVEPALVGAFVGRADAAALRGLQRWIDAEEAARARGDRRAAIGAAGDFHLHVARHAGHPILERLLQQLVLRTSLVLMRFGPRDLGETPACECRDHRAIAAAIRLRDRAAAERLTLEHLERLERQLDFVPAPAASPALAELLAR